MKAINIKWDVTDGTEDMTKKEMDEILNNLPTEVEIPSNITNDKNFDSDDLYEDCSDWLSNEYGFCHYGFELIKDKDKEG